jgi:hypothetical protein
VNSDGSNAAYFVINGLSPAGDTGTAYIGRYAVLTLLQGFLLGGSNPHEEFRIPQLPLVRIVTPKESADFVEIEAIALKWDLDWLRWDYQPYNVKMTGNESERTALIYVVKYSPDEGRTWFYGVNDEETSLGEYPPESVRISNQELSWGVEGKKGNFFVRVEAFRENIPLHYAFHQIGISIKR